MNLTNLLFFAWYIFRYADHDGFYNYSRTILRSYFECNFQNVDIRTLTHNFIGYSFKNQMYMDCLNNTSNLSEQEKYLRVKNCIHILRRICLSAKHRIVKVVRLPMAFAGSLLGLVNNLHIIHLIRDPRGIYNSAGK